MTEDERYMKEALKCARRALEDGEVPIGAVIVYEGKIIARGRNRRRKRQLATAHAEIEAIDRACKKLGSWRIPDCVLYVTLEPCPMCLGAAIGARIKKVCYGAPEDKGRSVTPILANANTLNHKIECEGGILADECSKVLSGFFADLRGRERDDGDGADT